MELKRVLIVDDEPNVALTIAASLEKLGRKYVIEVAHDGHEALTKLRQTCYALLISDYQMPDMNGLDLARTVRRFYPETQLMLMTAYGTDILRRQVGDMALDGYIDKPFSMQQVREIVERAIGQTRPKSGSDSHRAGEQAVTEAGQNRLKSLHAHTGARCVLLISASGYPVSIVGVTDNLDVTSVSALVAANFLASVELANLLGSRNSAFKSSYHEGSDYNIYAYDVNGELLIAVIFGAESKPGLVWFYTKQTAVELEGLVIHRPARPLFSEDNVAATFEAELDNLFGQNQESNPGLALPKGEQASPASVTRPAIDNSPPLTKDTRPCKPMTFEQAVAAGLVPPQILDRERKR